MVLPWKPHSLIELADTTAGDLAGFGAAHPIGLGQLLLLDHFESAPAVQTALNAMCGACSDSELVMNNGGEKVSVLMGVAASSEVGGDLVTVVKQRRYWHALLPLFLLLLSLFPPFLTRS